MKHKVWSKVHKAAASLTMSVAVLAIANVEMIWQGYQAKTEVNENLQAHGQSQHTRVKLELETKPDHFKPLQSALSQSLEQDELKDENPFAHLANLDPLRQLMNKGVTKFHRETFRSPDYQDESGYDLLSYEITHGDGSKSSILAYLEKTDSTLWRNVGAPDPRAVYVVFYVAGKEQTVYSFFRSGVLVEQAELSQADAEKQVAQRLSQGVPFLSVSR